MKKVIFNLKSKEVFCIKTLMKTLNNTKFNVRIEFGDDDFVLGQNENIQITKEVTYVKVGASKIAIYNLCDSFTDMLIDFINENYEIMSIDICNIEEISEVEEIPETEETSVVEETAETEETLEAEETAETEEKPEVEETPVVEETAEVKEIAEAEEILEVERHNSWETKKCKGRTQEDALQEMFGDLFKDLDKSQTVEEQAKIFLNNINFDDASTVVVQAFRVGCDVKRISYGNVIARLSEFHSEISVVTLKDAFENWVSKYPDLKKEFPKISIISLIRIFAKKHKK